MALSRSTTKTLIRAYYAAFNAKEMEGAFFAIRGGKVARISNDDNLEDSLKQVKG